LRTAAGKRINSLAAKGEQVLADRKKANIQKRFANRYKNINRTKARQRNFHNLVQRGSQVVDSARDRAGRIKRGAVNKGMYVAGNVQRVPGNIARAARRVANNKVARTVGMGIGAAGVGAGSMLGLTAAQKKIWERQGYSQYGSKRQKTGGRKMRR